MCTPIDARGFCAWLGRVTLFAFMKKHYCILSAPVYRRLETPVQQRQKGAWMMDHHLSWPSDACPPMCFPQAVRHTVQKYVDVHSNGFGKDRRANIDAFAECQVPQTTARSTAACRLVCLPRKIFDVQHVSWKCLCIQINISLPALGAWERQFYRRWTRIVSSSMLVNFMISWGSKMLWVWYTERYKVMNVVKLSCNVTWWQVCLVEPYLRYDHTDFGVTLETLLVTYAGYSRIIHEGE